MKLSKFIIEEDIGNYNVLYNLLNGISIKYNKKEFKNLDFILENNTIKNFLIEKDFFIKNGYPLKEYSLIRNNSYIQNIIITITKRCNFRCKYCYENFEDKSFKDDLADKIIKLISKKTLKVLTINWFGGEPLLEIDVIEKITYKLLDYCKSNDIEYYSTITTNGYLLSRENMERLKNVKVKYFQITIDGNEYSHNKNRVLKSGLGTFNRVLNNMTNRAMENKDCNFICRINADKNNYENILLFLKFFKKNFNFIENIKIDIHKIKDFNGNCGCLLDDTELLNLIEYGVDLGLNIMPILSKINPQSFCYFKNRNSIILTPDKKVYKCSADMENEYLSVGIINEETINLDMEKLNTLTNYSLNRKCYMCKYLPICQGSVCPLRRLRSKKLDCNILKGNEKRLLSLLDKQGLIDYSIEGVKR